MKKANQDAKDDLRVEYKRSDFSGKMVRGKYAGRLREASNVVVLNPDVAAVFPNGDAVNKALQSLIEVAQATTHLTRPKRQGKKICAA